MHTNPIVAVLKELSLEKESLSLWVWKRLLPIEALKVNYTRYRLFALT
jgi:hypothetical protein